MSGTGSSGLPVPETEAMLQRVAGMIASARTLPLSSSVKLDNKDEILELLREASERLPEELRQARWMLKEREEYLAATKRQADELVEAARSEAQRLVQRTEILKDAQAKARRVQEESREDAQKRRLEADDYVDQKLAKFEIILERTMKTVAAGREKLAGGPETADERPSGPVPVAPGPTESDTRWTGGPPAPPPAPAPAAVPSPFGHSSSVRLTPASVPGPPAGAGRNGPVGPFGMGSPPGADDGSWAEDSIFDQDSLD